MDLEYPGWDQIEAKYIVYNLYGIVFPFSTCNGRYDFLNPKIAPKTAKNNRNKISKIDISKV